MGIKNLHKFLQDNAPNYHKEKHLSTYRDKRVAVDVSIYLYKYKTIYKDNWPVHFIDMISILVKNGLDCLFIYDMGSPIEKQEKKDERRSIRDNAFTRIAQIEEAIESYQETGIIPDILKQIIQHRSTRIKKLLPSVSSQSFVYDKQVIDKELNILKSRVISVSKKDTLLSKSILDLFNISYCNAEAEAETLCAHLCVHGVVDAILTDDTDVLAYGSPIFLDKLVLSVKNTNPNREAETVMEICYDTILKELELTAEEFLDLCIMCGTDYNKNIYRVGPKKIYKLLKQYHSIEAIKENTAHDVSILNHLRIRDLFRVPPSLADIPNIKKAVIPDSCDINLFAVKNNIRVGRIAQRSTS